MSKTCEVECVGGPACGEVLTVADPPPLIVCLPCYESISKHGTMFASVQEYVLEKGPPFRYVYTGKRD